MSKVWNRSDLLAGIQPKTLTSSSKISESSVKERLGFAQWNGSIYWYFLSRDKHGRDISPVVLFKTQKIPNMNLNGGKDQAKISQSHNVFLILEMT